MHAVTLRYKGRDYAFKPSYDLFLQIETRVSFNRIADAARQAGLGAPVELPLSHVAWVLFCCMRAAGIAVNSPGDVLQQLFDKESLPHYGITLGELIAAFYGPGPEKPVKKKRGKKPAEAPPTS